MPAESKGKGKGRERPQQDSWARKTCRFTRDGATDVDYKDVQTLRAMVSATGKIIPCRNTGTSTFFQRRVSVAVKRARYLALLPYCDRHN